MDPKRVGAGAGHRAGWLRMRPLPAGSGARTLAAGPGGEEGVRIQAYDSDSHSPSDALPNLSRKWYGRLPPQGLTSKRKMNSAQNTTYPPGASHLGTTGVMCLRRARQVVPRP